jgi:hypothetical protein
MDRKYIDDHHIVERYLAEKLSDEECAAFEAYYLKHPEVVQEMEAAARAKVGMAKLAESGELDRAVDPIPRRTAIARFAAAAAIVAMIAIGVQYWPSDAKPSVLAASVAELNMGLEAPLALVDGAIPVMRTRAGEQTISLEIPSDPRALELSILSETPAFKGPYRVSLTSSGNQRNATVIGVVDQLQTDRNGVLHVFLSSRALQPGAYELRVEHGEPPSASEASVFVVVARRQ